MPLVTVGKIGRATRSSRRRPIFLLLDSAFGMGHVIAEADRNRHGTIRADVLNI